MERTEDDIPPHIDGKRKRKPVRNIIHGSLLGVMIGDTYGLARERGSGVTGRYSDDTQMTMALAEALVEEGRDVTPDVLARYFAEHYQRERHYGGVTDRILSAIRSGVRWDVAVAQYKYPGGSWGNGAAMRVAPIGFVFDTPAEVSKAASRQCAATGHTHEDAELFACLQAEQVLRIARGRAFGKSIPQLVDELTPVQWMWEKYSPAMQWVGLNLHAHPREVGPVIGCGVRASESVPCALWAFLSGAAGGPMEVIERAIAIGGDSDTIGAMAGALVGACYGQDGWPEEVVAKLENEDFGKDFMLSLADDLTEISPFIQDAIFCGLP